MAESLMIQAQVLNYVLQKKDSSLIVLNNLTEDHFSTYPNEFKFIKAHLDRYGNICDLATFLDHFRDFEVIEVNESPDYLIKALMEDYKSRTMTAYTYKMRELILSNKMDEASQLTSELLEKINSVGVSMKCVDLIQDTSRYDAYLERIKEYDKYYIKTGFDELDAIVGGFDRQEELGTIVARTNYGKSWILLKCVVASVQQGLNVGVYSGEMSENKVGYRFDTLLGHMNNGGIIHGNSKFQLEYEDYIKKLPTMVKGSVKVITPAMINGPADVNALRLFIEKYNLDILFIDQLSLLEDQRKGKTPVEKASNISKDLKILQVMKKIPIISVSQQNRTSSENGVDTTQIAMSDRIGQDSTMIIFLEKKDDVMKLTLVKSRDSENGKVLTYNVNLNTGQFIYIPDEKDGLGGKVDDKYAERYIKGKDVFDV